LRVVLVLAVSKCLTAFGCTAFVGIACRTAIIVAAVNVGFCLGADAWDLNRLPANQWVALPAQYSLRGYEYGRPVFVPTRRQLLHWDVTRRIYQVPRVPRNDVRALDLPRGQWAGDYPSSEDRKGAPSIHDFSSSKFRSRTRQDFGPHRRKLQTIRVCAFCAHSGERWA
jgi:hypothetical protein